MKHRTRINKGSMTGRFLLVIASIADENGEYNVKDAVKAIDKEYPALRTLYSTSTTQLVSLLVQQGYTEMVWSGRHRMPFATLDLMEANGFPMERLAVSV